MLEVNQNKQEENSEKLDGESHPIKEESSTADKNAGVPGMEIAEKSHSPWYSPQYNPPPQGYPPQGYPPPPQGGYYGPPPQGGYRPQQQGGYYGPPPQGYAGAQQPQGYYYGPPPQGYYYAQSPAQQVCCFISKK